MRHLLNAITLTLLSLIASSAIANVRAPVSNDGDVASAIRTQEAIDSVVLEGEILSIAFNRILDESWGESAAVVAQYTLRNTSTAPVSLDLQFMATDIEKPVVSLNGVELPEPETSPMNATDREEALAMLKPLRSQWSRDDEFQPQVATYRVVLEPGLNTMKFKYKQTALFYENTTRYGMPETLGATIGLDYLLYPAKSWQVSKSFKLAVRVVIPDMLDDGWFVDDYYEPLLSANYTFEADYDETSRVTTFSGTFDELGDVLSLRFKWGDSR